MIVHIVYATTDINSKSIGAYNRLILEKERSTHASILAWRIPWAEEPGGLQYMGSQESDTT